MSGRSYGYSELLCLFTCQKTACYCDSLFGPADHFELPTCIGVTRRDHYISFACLEFCYILFHSALLFLMIYNSNVNLSFVLVLLIRSNLAANLNISLVQTEQEKLPTIISVFMSYAKTSRRLQSKYLSTSLAVYLSELLPPFQRFLNPPRLEHMRRIVPVKCLCRLSYSYFF